MKKEKRIALGVGISLGIYLGLLALLSLLIVRGSAPEGSIRGCVWAFACAAAFAGAMTASRGAEPVAPSAVCAAAFYGLILLLGFMVNDGLDAARATGLAIPVCIGAGIACLLKRGGKRGKKKRSRRARK